MAERFGRYELLTSVGKGGMAEIFRARHQSPAGAEKILVIKRILPSYSSDPEFIRLFVNEAKIALPLTHGNITSTFEFGEVDGIYYLAMEYIHGQNVGAIFDRCQDTLANIPIPASLAIAAEVAKGLAYAHGYTSPHGERTEIVHLDVSPQNVLVSYDGAVKLTDFGIARVRASAQPEERLIRGKINYLAPEVLAGEKADGRADVFSLGSVLYALLTGHRPFAGRDDDETIARIQRGEVRPPSELNADLADLDELLLRALAHDREERFASAADFEVAITRALFERSAGYSSRQLGDWMQDLFAWEIYNDRPIGDEDDPLRDRLLFQLSQAKVSLPKSDSKTKELLALPTVSIPRPDVIDTSEASSGFRAGLLVGLAVIAVLVFGAGLAFNQGWFAIAATQQQKLDAAPTAVGYGRLSLNSWPTAIVYLDGKRLPGTTPIIGLEVKAGPHRVEFVRNEFGAVKTLHIDVPAGEQRTVVVTLDR